LPPSQIVPSLADIGIYIASESTMYRILKCENIQHHRGDTKSPENIKKPTTYISTGPNEVWTWDITSLHYQHYAEFGIVLIIPKKKLCRKNNGNTLYLKFLTKNFGIVINHNL
jgi:hypothetical protein